MPATPPAALDLADRLHSAALRLLRGLRRHDAASGLSGPRLSALSVLVYAGPLSLGALARAEQVRPPSMSRLVAALEAEGLVRRTADPGDARAVRLVATAKGRRLLVQGRRRRVAALAEAVAALGDGERARLLAALDVLERLGGRRPDAEGADRRGAG